MPNYAIRFQKEQLERLHSKIDLFVKIQPMYIKMSGQQVGNDLYEALKSIAVDIKDELSNPEPPKEASGA